MDIESYKNYLSFFRPGESTFCKQLFDLSPIAMGAVEVEEDEFKYISENRAARLLFSSFTEKLNTIEDCLYYCRISEALKQPQTFEYRYNEDHKRHWYSITVNFLEYNHEGIPRFYYHILEVSNYREFEENLQHKVDERTAEIRTVLQTMYDGVMVFDEDGKVIFINEAHARICGQNSPNEMEKDILSHFRNYPLYDLDYNLVSFEERPFGLLLKGQQFKDKEYRLKVLSNGQERFLSYSGNKIKSHAGKRKLFVYVVKDITQLKKSDAAQKTIQKDLQNAVRARDEFLSIASHELKTPLTSLKLQTQLEKRILVKRKLPIDPARIAQFLHRTEVQVQQLIHLVNDMLDISSISSGTLILHPKMNDLLSIVKEARDKSKDLFKHTGTELHITHGDSCVGLWDRQRLEQVLVNLITNAAKYGKGKPIELTLECHKSQAILKIRDFGRGILENDMKRIFHRFERAISANEVSGLGLGLFISQEIIKLHGGVINVESRVNIGSTFTITLPIIKENLQ